MDELVGAKTKPLFSNFQRFSLDYIVFPAFQVHGFIILNDHPYTLEPSHLYTITTVSIPVKIIIALYKCPLDAYRLKSCEQNDSQHTRTHTDNPHRINFKKPGARRP